MTNDSSPGIQDRGGAWRFRALARNEKRVDSLASEFFADQADLDTLVRESIQNCLDARDLEKVIVRVRSSSSADEMTGPAIDRWLGGLARHAVASGVTWPEDLAMAYLVIEDFGATGLVGNPQSLAETPENNFYWFWRNEGRSGKGTGKRGSRGVGKWTYPASSRVRAFFGLSVTKDSERPTLLGQSVLKIHPLDGQQYETWGWFASYTDEDEFQVPVHDQVAVETFKRDFKITRGAASGLSIIIPWPSVSFEARNLARIVVEQYFFPLLARQLVVEIQDGAKPLIRVNETSAERWAPGSTKLIALGSWALDQREGPNSGIVDIHVEESRWRTGTIPEERVQELRHRLSSGNRLALRIHVPVVSTDGTARIGAFEVFCERDESITPAEEVYIREGITLSDIHRVGIRPFRGILVIDDSILAPVMRDAEGPAHTHWAATDRVKQKYRDGSRLILFVRDALKTLAELLLESPSGLDKDLLEDLFSVPNESTATRQPGDPTEDPPIVDPPPSPPTPFRVSQTGDGFVISARSAEGGTLATVEVAYGVRRGDAFAKYETLDFSLGQSPIVVAIDGGRVLSSIRNQLSFEVTAPGEFKLAVTGFSAYRDLKVRLLS